MYRLLSPNNTCPINFHFTQFNIHLVGYQLYAVENWLLNRNQLNILTVYTGDSSHKISVAASSTHNPQHWHAAIHLLKRYGASPRQTPDGTLMVTSLANFPSDLSIVHIPDGDFLSVRDHLYANINLLRFACSGRSALTLQHPSESTKNRFTSMYHLPPQLHSKSFHNSLFDATVLELVKLLQTALSIFGFFRSDIDGLLCDLTVQGIHQWLTDIGEPCLGLEPMEHVADPVLVSALLSFILAIRNILAAIGYAHVTPKDPFLHPQAFTNALAAYLQSTHSPHLSFISPHSPPLPTALSPASSNSTSASTPRTGPILTRALVDSIRAAYDKPRQTDRKVRRVLHRLDDFVGGSDPDGEGKDSRHAGRAASSVTVDTGSGGAQILSGIGNLASGLRLGGSGSGGDAGAIMDPIMDLGLFVSIIDGKEKKPRGIGIGRDDRAKDGKEKDAVAGSVRCLWNGRVENLIRMREGAQCKPGGRSDEKAVGVASDADAEDDRERERTESKSTEDESDALGAFARPWSGRMQKKIESWAGLGWKRQNNELKTGRNESRSQSPLLPALVVSGETGEEEDLLSSGQVSPVSELRVNPFSVFHSGMSAESSALNLDASDYERRVSAFNQKRPWLKGYYQSRVSSWSDPVTGGDIGGERNRTSVIKEEGESVASQVLHGVKRRRSFHDLESYRDVRVLNIEWLKIDVELCGQWLVMRGRGKHLQSVVACLQVLTNSLSTKNTRLREDYHAHQPYISEIDSRTRVIAELEAQRAQTVTTQETSALLYESEQFRLPELWRAASPPRQQVLDLREKVFGTGGRRLPVGVRGAHGRFNRLQWTLDGRERLVDWMGRTESDEEEEDAVEVADVVVPREEEEEDVVEHPGIKPMWLLRFFNTWGARWAGPPAKKQEDDKVVKGSGKQRLRSSSPKSSVQPSPVELHSDLAF